MGFDVPRGIYIHICGTDLVRDDDGDYLVLEDNAALPVRRVLRAGEPPVMKRSFPAALRGGRRAAGRRLPGDAARHAALHRARRARPTRPSCCSRPASTTRPTSSTASSRGRWASSWSKAATCVVRRRRASTCGRRAGLQRVDVIYRRIDDDFLDPLVFRADSLLGVPGLMQRLPRRQRRARQRHRHRRRRRQGRSTPSCREMIRYYLTRTRSCRTCRPTSRARTTDRSYVLEQPATSWW